jgi:hypothetical protein
MTWAESPVGRLGARQAGQQAQPRMWRVMLDPVGHPFCLITAGAD